MTRVPVSDREWGTTVLPATSWVYSASVIDKLRSGRTRKPSQPPLSHGFAATDQQAGHFSAETDYVSNLLLSQFLQPVYNIQTDIMRCGDSLRRSSTSTQHHAGPAYKEVLTHILQRTVRVVVPFPSCEQQDDLMLLHNAE